MLTIGIAHGFSPHSNCNLFSMFEMSLGLCNHALTLMVVCNMGYMGWVL